LTPPEIGIVTLEPPFLEGDRIVKARHSSWMLVALMFVLLPGLGAGPAQSAEAPPPAIYRGLLPVAHFDVSPPFWSLRPDLPEAEMEEREWPDDLPTGLEGSYGKQEPDGAVQRWFTAQAGVEIPGPSASFDGPGNPTGANPPDPNGDVGPNHVVVIYNSQFAVYDKTGVLQFGPVNINTLWSGFGGPCQNENAGDPVALYDQQSDRWFLSQFTAAGPTFFNCVAVSQTPDPAGTYYRWAFTTGNNFPDYPKNGLWPDGFYMSTREFIGGSGGPFGGVGAYVANRAQLVAGNPTPQVISFLQPPGATPYNVGDGLLPTDLDGPTLPPPGTPNFFVGSLDQGGQYGAPLDALSFYEFHADFAVPSNSTFALTHTIPTASFDSVFPCTPNARACIPQPGTAAKLDILSYRQRPLHRLAYRNYGVYESLVTNQSVEAPGAIAGVRWYELRDPSGTPVIHQQGTYSPDSVHRWMGSAAMDGSGSVALAYSVSDAVSVFPGLRYTGRLAYDALGTMPQGEGVYHAGVGVQTTANSRWGDYTSLTVDPVDDCTFWHVNEYYPVTSTSFWRLRVGAFKFAECGTPDFSLAPAPLTRQICAPADAVYSLGVGSYFGYAGSIDLSASGLPAGATAVFSDDPSVPPVTGTFSVTNTGSATPGSYVMTVTGTPTVGPAHSIDVALDLFTAVPAAPALSSPADGAAGVALRPTLQWNAAAQGVTYLVELDDDPGFGSPIHAVTQTGTSFAVPSDLESSSVYYWRVRSNNLCGPGSFSATFNFTTLATPDACAAGSGAFVRLAQNWESGAGAWTSGGTGNSWAQSSVRKHSGNFSWLSVPAAVQSDQQLVSPSVAIPTGETPVSLVYWNHQTMESNGPTGCFDAGNLEISTNGGSTWTQITTGLLTDPYDGLVDAGNVALGGRQGWCGDPQDWTKSVVNLAPYAGQTVKFRFRLGSDTGTTREGWYLDDIQVTSCVTNLIFNDGFEIGTTSRWSLAFP
jgi:hypothetical protein